MMVNFDNDITATVPPVDLLKILLLERRKYMIDAIEYWHKCSCLNIQMDISLLYSRIIAMLTEIKPAWIKLGAKKEKNDCAFAVDLLKKKQDPDSWVEAAEMMLAYLYDVGLTKFDNKVRYDTSNVELDNKMKGYL